MMQYGVDPIAFAVALVAIWFTWKETRRNNRPILKVLKCDGSSTMSVESQGKLIHNLEVWIQNRGISLYGVRVVLNFREKDGMGQINCDLQRSSVYDKDCPEFARGMVGAFCLKSNPLIPGDNLFFRMLDNPTKQHACLNVYAQNYLAYSIRIGGFLERAKLKWNRIANWFNGLFTHKHGTSQDGYPMIHIPTILPRFVIIEPQIIYFLREVLRTSEKAKAEL